MTAKFIHLHVHSQYSLVDGLGAVDQLIDAARADNMPAVALTDYCNLFAHVKFYKAAIKTGIKPLLGVDLLVDWGEKSFGRVILLAQTNLGYRHMMELVSEAYLHRESTECLHIKWDSLKEKNAGLIAIGCGIESRIGQCLLSKHTAVANSHLAQWREVFDDRYYLSIHQIGVDNEALYVQSALSFASEHRIGLVATNFVCFLNQSDMEAHEARVCIHQGQLLDSPDRERRYKAEQYFKTQSQMQELFKAVPEVLANTVELAKRCNAHLTLDQTFLPNFPIPKGQTLDVFFENEVHVGLKERLDFLNKNGQRIKDESVYHARIEHELSVIERMGFSGYFLIVADFIRWAREHDVPVGPGRGSGAGSLVAYCLRITDCDPLAYDLLFERFLNPERVSLPDFDIDFCMDGRDRVIEYVAEKYGRDSVSQIITFGTMAAKAVVRDVGRVLGHPYGFVDKVAKLIPFELGMTLEKALRDEEQLLDRYRNEEEVSTLIDLGMKLEGTPRNAGKHAGGVVIAPSKLTDFTALYCESAGESVVSQLDKDDVEAIGLVKFDFLGLRTLTIIDWTIKQLKETIDISAIPLDDEKTYQYLGTGNTTAIFQLESRGMKDLIRRLKPDSFDDIVALVALFRPGPLQAGMVDSFINRKQGREKVSYLHPMLEPILRTTYGVILYQEQVMQIAQDLAGYTLGGADMLRRAMGKKKPEEMAKQREIFVKGAGERQIEAKLAGQIFDLMETFAGYGFNKSHSVAYALLSYQTAWLKVHYPAEFMAAVMSSDMDNTDKVVVFYEEALRMGLDVLAPNINEGMYSFSVTPASKVRYGLGAIKGVGEAAIDAIVAEREANGPYKDLYDLTHRLDNRKINRRVLEALCRSGALSIFGVNRGVLFASIDQALKASDQYQSAAQQGQSDLFGGEAKTSLEAVTYADVAPWGEEQKLLAEKEALGLYFSGHPISLYEGALKQLGMIPIRKLKQSKLSRVGGYISDIRTKFTKSGNRMAFISLEDKEGRLDVIAFGELYQQFREVLVKDKLVVLEGEISPDEYTGSVRMSMSAAYTFDEARAQYGRCLVLSAASGDLAQHMTAELKSILAPCKGGQCVVKLRAVVEGVPALISLPKEWMITPTAHLMQSCQQLGFDIQLYH